MEILPTDHGSALLAADEKGMRLNRTAAAREVQDVLNSSEALQSMDAQVAQIDTNAAQAKAASLEALADDTLTRIAEFFGKAVNTKGFCGLSVEETIDAHGNVCSFTLTACELVGGEPLRRVAAKAH